MWHHLHRVELAPLLAEVGVELSPEQLQLLVASLDFNNDGAIDLAEIEAALGRLAATVGHAC